MNLALILASGTNKADIPAVHESPVPTVREMTLPVTKGDIKFVVENQLGASKISAVNSPPEQWVKRPSYSFDFSLVEIFFYRSLIS